MKSHDSQYRAAAYRFENLEEPESIVDERTPAEKKHDAELEAERELEARIEANMFWKGE